MAERGLLSARWGWAGLALGLAFGAVLAWPLNSTVIDWQPSLALPHPWRAFTAVFVHYSALHLGANLAGTLLVGLLGHVTPVPARCVVAWLIAWPLTQWGLLIQPELIHYGGLSGLLHAGVTVVAVHLLFNGTTPQRRIGLAILAVVFLKVVHEAPWEGALRHPDGWDIAVAPLAHATGAISGTISGMLAEWWHRGRHASSDIAR